MNQNRIQRRRAKMSLRKALEPVVAARDREEFVVTEGPIGFEERIVTATGRQVKRYGVWPRVVVGIGLVTWAVGLIIGLVTS